jgi:4-amino-4-deoxy-L-arabinose transferase-like glycosyltransferase
VTADLLGLLLVNLCFLAGGVGVTALCGWWRGLPELARSLGASYLAGVATYGVLAQLLYVLGASLARWQVLAVCGVPATAAVLGLCGSSESKSRRRRVLAAVPLAAFLALVAVDLWWQPLWTYDAWTFWTPKAHALVALNGLDPSWFSSTDLLNKDYPLLLPAVEAAGLRFTGYETALLDFQSLLFLVAFVRAVYETGVARARPIVLWAVLALLVAAPSVIDQLASAEADLPEAAFFGCAGLCAYLWLTERSRGSLPLAAVLAAGAAATKVEGVGFTIALFVSLAAVSIRGLRRDSALALGAGAAALAAGVLPWRLWMHAHDVANQAALGRFGLHGLASHLLRAPEAAAYLLAKMLDPRAWLLLVPSSRSSSSRRFAPAT